MSSSNNPPLRLGIVGAGFIGQLAHLANYVDMPDVRIVALAETRPDQRNLVLQRYGIPQGFATHLEMLANAEIDAVVAVTRRHNTGPVALDVIKAGKHVLTEKPMAATLEQAEQLAAAARLAKVNYAVGYMRRHDAGVQAAKAIYDDLVDSDRWGSVLAARLHCYCGEDYCGIKGFLASDEKRPDDLPGWDTVPAWLPADLSRPYDRFMNIWTHDVNLLRHFFGEMDVDHARFRTGGGSLVAFDTGKFGVQLEFGEIQQNRWDEGLEIIFERGMLRITLPPAMLRNVEARVEVISGSKDNSTTVIEGGWSWAFRRQAEAFVSDIRTQSTPLANGDDSVGDHRLIEAIWRRISQ